MKQALIVDGRDDDERRALFVISALYHCVDVLRERPVRFVGVSTVEVEIAIRVLEFDTGIRATVVEDARNAMEQAFSDAVLYVAVVLEDVDSVSRAFAETAGVRCLVVPQFPREHALSVDNVSRLAAAHSHAGFGALIRTALSS